MRLDEEVLCMRSHYLAAFVAAATSVALTTVGALPAAGATERRQPSGQIADQVYEAIAESSDPAATYAALAPSVRDEFDDHFLPATYA